MALTRLNVNTALSATLPVSKGGTGVTTAADLANTGNLVKLASTEITSSTAAIIFDSSVVTAYDNYLIILNGIKAVSNTASGGIMFSTDNGSSFIGRVKFTAYYLDLESGTAGLHTGTFSLNSVTNPTMWDNNNTKPLSGEFLFQNCNPLNDGSQNVHCQYHSIYTNQSDTEYQQRGAVMYDITAGQQINYFKIVNATVNLDEGRATLYGFNT